MRHRWLFVHTTTMNMKVLHRTDPSCTHFNVQCSMENVDMLVTVVCGVVKEE